MNLTTAILVWPFGDAPTELQALSTNGGDEDWLALVPPHLTNSDIPWLGSDDDAGPFGVCCINHYPLPDGRLVVIGAHA